MSIKKTCFGLLILNLLIVFRAYSQTSFKAGNRDFEHLSYVEALKHYETFVGDAKNGDEDLPEALSKLAFCYKKLQDYRNAERVYRQLFKDHENILDSKEYLYYAQVLASNSKYKDSQKYYSIYGEQQASDVRAKNFTVAYMDNTPFYRDSSLYKIKYLDALNTQNADFSPAYYKKGLVFVSAREEKTATKRMFMNNQTPFLDLFIYPDTAALGVSWNRNSTSSRAISRVASADKLKRFSKKLNSKYHEGPVTFFSNQRQILFTRNNHINGRTDKSKRGVNKLKLFSAKYDGSDWDHIEELPFNSNEYSCGHPSLTRDNQKMYFSSDMPGGFGGTDIYVVDYNRGNWGVPINLGADINTEGNEMFPFIDEYDNLYFASNGQAGLGGLDIFYVELENGKAKSAPENLGAPINSAKDDFGIITDGERNTGFFSSNRKNGYSDDNIYAFNRKCRQLDIMVYDAVTEEPIAQAEVRLVKSGVNQDMHKTDEKGLINVCMSTGLDFEFRALKEGYESNSVSYNTMATSEDSNAKIKIYLMPSNLPLVKGTIRSELTDEPINGVTVVLTNERNESTATVVTGKDGKYEFQPTEKGKYVVSAVKGDYATNTEAIGKVKPRKKKNITYEQNLGMIAEGDIFRIENIYYNYGKSTIRRDARKELEDTVLPILRKYPSIVIEIRSHTDSRSGSDFNLQLSNGRANSVVTFLAKRGIGVERMIATGFGEKMLVNGCANGVDCSERQHQLNRRTEFKVLNVAQTTASSN